MTRHTAVPVGGASNNCETCGKPLNDWEVHGLSLLDLQGLVNDLIAQGHGDRLVVLSHDEEGNGFAPVTEEWSMGRFVPARFSWGDFVDDAEKEDPPTGIPAIVLWPGA